MLYKSRKRPKPMPKRGVPDGEGEGAEYKDHELYGIWGIFNERLYWECANCDEVRLRMSGFLSTCSESSKE